MEDLELKVATRIDQTKVKIANLIYHRVMVLTFFFLNLANQSNSRANRSQGSDTRSSQSLNRGLGSNQSSNQNLNRSSNLGLTQSTQALNRGPNQGLNRDSTQPCTSRQAMEESSGSEIENGQDNILQNYTCKEMLRMAKTKEFPRKYFKFANVYKSYTPVLHFFDHTQVY